MKDKLSKIEELLEICIEAKEYGIDCFFTYSPHVAWISVSTYEDGWKEFKYPDRDKDIPSDSMFFEEQLDQEIEYIKALIKKKKEEQING